MKIRDIFAIFGTAVIVLFAWGVVDSYEKRELRRGISSNAEEIVKLRARVIEVERSLSRTIDSLSIKSRTRR
jgi:hypothetical protein